MGHKREVDISKHFSIAKFSSNTCIIAFMLHTNKNENTFTLHILDG